MNERVFYTSYPLSSILAKNKYPAYAEEVERMRQERMDSRLEWRRQKENIRFRNRCIKWIVIYLWIIATLGGCLLLSEFLRLMVWSILR